MINFTVAFLVILLVIEIIFVAFINADGKVEKRNHLLIF